MNKRSSEFRIYGSIFVVCALLVVGIDLEFFGRTAEITAQRTATAMMLMCVLSESRALAILMGRSFFLPLLSLSSAVIRWNISTAAGDMALLSFALLMAIGIYLTKVTNLEERTKQLLRKGGRRI